MSIYVRLARKARGLSPKAKSALMALASYADPVGRSFPSQQTLADDMGCSPRTAWAALEELEAGGWIVREKRQRRDGSRTSDLITIQDAARRDAYLARMRRLPLVAMLEGGQPQKPAPDDVDKPVHNPVENTQSNSQSLRIGQLAKFARQ